MSVVLGTRPVVRNHYRSTKMSLWLDLIPRLHRSEGLSPRYHLLDEYTRVDAFDHGTRPIDLIALLPHNNLLQTEENHNQLLQPEEEHFSTEPSNVTLVTSLSNPLDEFDLRKRSRSGDSMGQLKDYTINTITLLHFISGIGGSLLVFNFSLLFYICYQRKRLREIKRDRQHAIQLQRTLAPTVSDMRASRKLNGSVTNNKQTKDCSKQSSQRALPVVNENSLNALCTTGTSKTANTEALLCTHQNNAREPGLPGSVDSACLSGSAANTSFNCNNLIRTDLQSAHERTISFQKSASNQPAKQYFRWRKFDQSQRNSMQSPISNDASDDSSDGPSTVV